MEFEISQKILLTVFLMAMVLGATVQKTNFCTMGAVSDWVLMGDRRRFRSWLLAMAVAIIGVLIMEATGTVDLNDSRIPYRGAVFFWPRYITGGLMFGIGMTLAGGCGNRNLVRVGGGNMKSLLVVLVMAVFAYLMTRTDFYGVLFHSWMFPMSPDLQTSGVETQEIGVLVAAAVDSEALGTLRMVIGGAVVLALLLVVFKSKDFNTSLDHLLGGLIVGLVVVGGWYLTAGPWGQEWIEAAEFADEPPAGVGVQSYTFISPMADTLAYLANPANTIFITFGVASLSGVITGSLVYSILSRRFHIEWFASWGDFARQMGGAVLMGVGGVLALGCTIGQGVTGISTMALGSVIALISIVFGAALAIKVQYYKLLFEEASFMAALVTSLVDLRLLPNSLRKLEAL